MSEVNTGAPPAQEPDRLQNLQAEFQRKFENQTSELVQTKQMLSEVLNRLPKPPEPKPEDDGDLLYSNPTAYKQKLRGEIVSEVKQTVTQTLEQQRAAEQERLGTLQKLAADFPELNKADSGLYQETVKILNAMPENQRQTAQAYQMAVYQAAAQEGLRPVSKRNPAEGVENFSFDGKKSAPAKKNGPRTEEIDPKTLAWMELLDPDKKYFDPSKEKDIEDLKRRSKKNYREPNHE